MKYRRHYVQFNDLILDDVTENDTPVSFKTNLQEYSYTHGSYSPKKSLSMLVNSSDTSLTIRVKMKKLPCDARPFYRDYVIGQLSTPGKMWAVQNNTLIWAYAEVKSISEPSDVRDDRLEFEVDVSFPEGVWHKADLQRTFLKPWNICDFMDCHDFHEIKPCLPLDGDCCKCGKENHPLGCNCCDCTGLSKDMALCYHTKELQGFYSCDRDYQIVYSCEDKFFNDASNYIGVKMCTDNGTIAGRLYSNTDIPTGGITIRFSGVVTNPIIEINGNANQIKGTYQNLTIYPDGTATHGCDGCAEVDVGDWVIHGDYGWVVNQGYNRVVIDTGNCCGVVCAYIEIDALTI